jgi:prepilin-type N-terminal cleavage/methylation domain-containing protein
MRPGREQGLTLMEVLIAVSLVGLMSVGILMSIRVGLNSMEKTNKKLMANRRVLGAQRILEQQVMGFMPVKVDCRTVPDRPGTILPFFQGEMQSMRFTSSYSIQEAARGFPRILEFQVIPGENSGGVRLVVNEILYTGPMSTGAMCVGTSPDPVLGRQVPIFRPIQVGTQSFVLADRLSYCRFTYLEPLPEPETARWTGRWVQARLPKAIRIEMAPLEEDLSKIQPLSVTLPLRVNRDVLASYAP